jgi:hypothetical protein
MGKWQPSKSGKEKNEYSNLSREQLSKEIEETIFALQNHFGTDNEQKLRMLMRASNKLAAKREK